MDEEKVVREMLTDAVCDGLISRCKADHTIITVENGKITMAMRNDYKVTGRTNGDYAIFGPGGGVNGYR